MKETLPFLTKPERALERIKGFNGLYVNHWREWLRASEGCDFQGHQVDIEVVIKFKEIMRKWWACGRYQPLRCETKLQWTLNAAAEPLRQVGSADLRSFQAPREELTDAIHKLWRIFEEGLCLERKASEVGVSKAILLVTKGRIGPAFDSKVKGALDAWYVMDGGTYLKALGKIASELAAFEVRESRTLESIAEQAGRPAEVGRVLDMVWGPRGREQRGI